MLYIEQEIKGLLIYGVVVQCLLDLVRLAQDADMNRIAPVDRTESYRAESNVNSEHVRERRFDAKSQVSSVAGHPLYHKLGVYKPLQHSGTRWLRCCHDCSNSRWKASNRIEGSIGLS